MADRPPKWRETPVPVTRCPYCDHRLDTASSPEGHAPSPGDFSVCIECASPLVYTDAMTLRPATRADLKKLDAQEAANLRRIQAAVRRVDRRRMKDG